MARVVTVLEMKPRFYFSDKIKVKFLLFKIHSHLYDYQPWQGTKGALARSLASCPTEGSVQT
jgi:hypothetical protein